MIKLKVNDARAVQKENDFDTWSARSYEANAAASRNASNRIWQDSVNIGIKPKFTIRPSEEVFAIGSCFAREIEEALAESGFAVPTFCDDLFEHPLLRYPDKEKAEAARLRPRSYLNRYNTMSMYEEFRHLLGLAPEIESGQLIYPLEKRAAADLHYSQALPQRTQDEALQRRALVRDYLGRALRRCSVFIVTLGLAEVWFDTIAGRYLNNTPGPRVMEAHADRLEVHLTTFELHLRALRQVHDLLTAELKHAFRIVVTVSPVPLEKTFFDQDVITTNIYSKSMLRAVAHEFASGYMNVDYFPSYEMVVYSPAEGSWVWDRRHVRPALVRHITDTFRKHYVKES
jgi:hypothetical protein